MSHYLIAPPGTRVGDSGWREVPPGLVLRWDNKGTVPAFAVQRDGVLMATGHITSCAHCGIPSTVPHRHICERATWDWSRLADPQLYGELLPYTPTMRIYVERVQLKVQEL
jgi:hypothetical protein